MKMILEKDGNVCTFEIDLSQIDKDGLWDIFQAGVDAIETHKP